MLHWTNTYHWMYDEQNKLKCCSRCKAEFPIDRRPNRIPFSFCPSCGTEMDLTVGQQHKYESLSNKKSEPVNGGRYLRRTYVFANENILRQFKDKFKDKALKNDNGTTCFYEYTNQIIEHLGKSYYGCITVIASFNTQTRREIAATYDLEPVMHYEGTKVHRSGHKDFVFWN